MSRNDMRDIDAHLRIGGLQVYQIEKTITKIGRSSGNDLILKYPQISRKHAEIRRKNDKFEIYDLNSTGGTFVNGKRIIRQELKKGDLIGLVNLHLVFEIGDVPDEAFEYQTPRNLAHANRDTKTLPRPKMGVANQK